MEIDNSQQYGCLYPGSCMVEGQHTIDVCLTARDLEALEEDTGLTLEEFESKLASMIVLEEDRDFKETALDEDDAWLVQTWETTNINGETYWRPTSGYRIDKTVVSRLARKQGG